MSQTGRITAIDHVGIAVADLDAAIAMYETAFGMRCVHTEVNEEQGVREAMLAVGDSGSYLQLLAPLSPVDRRISVKVKPVKFFGSLDACSF